MVLPQELDRNITILHLQDSTVYCQSTPEEFSKQFRRLTRRWVDGAEPVNLPRSITALLKCEHPVCPVMYVLIKTHNFHLVVHLTTLCCIRLGLS